MERTLGPVHVASVVDVEDDDSVAVLIDAVPHPVLASAGPPHALERRPQRRTDGTRAHQERPGDELPREGGLAKTNPGEP